MAKRENKLTSSPKIGDKTSIMAQTPERHNKNYAARVFQESSIGMIVSIVATNSKGRKVFKTLILILCVAGFLYQCSTYLIHALQYHTVVNVVIERPENYKIPAYTFCNNNGIKRSIFCDMYPRRCYKPSGNFCSETYGYCGNNDTKIPKEEFYDIEDTMNVEDFLKYGDNLKNFLISEKSKLHDNDSITGPQLRFKKGISGAMLCYSLHSVAVNNKYPALKRRTPSLLGNDAEDKLTFFVQENETLVPGNRPGILFAIHSPYQAVNPFTKGIFMKPGRTYRIYVSMEKEILLKDPFATRCMDYEEIWEASNHSGPRIQEMCHHKCLLEESMRCFNCVYPAVLYPTKERICNKSETSLDCDENIKKTLENCWHNCRDDCRVTRYIPKVMETYEVEYAEGRNIKELNQYITVEIHLEDDEMLALKYNPKYMIVEVFSAIGGFLGCWLGISLMDVTDALGSIFALSRYVCKKKKNTEESENKYL